ncbi:hypothetical protein B0H11DRAFT_1279612 [Mycena galericulata]|nr:hypothetical protein B0H11DRAFT_1279612 [Mycena galericulata]
MDYQAAPRTRPLRPARPSISAIPWYGEQSSNSIDPGHFDPRHHSSPRADVEDTIDEATILGTEHSNISIVPGPPFQRNLSLPPISSPLVESSWRRSEYGLPESPDTRDRLSSPQWPGVSMLHPPLLRPDPAADRAVALARECHDSAQTLYQELRRCDALLQVAQSARRCGELIGIFTALADGLLSEPLHIAHTCAPLGLCTQEVWHQRHAMKVQQLIERLERFLHDFPPSTPLSTSRLARKLSHTVEYFTLIQGGIQVCIPPLSSSCVSSAEGLI